MNDSFHRALLEGIEDAKAPGAVLLVGQGGRQIFVEAAGFAQLEPVRKPARADTLYDLASLTKVVATTTAIMLLRDRGVIILERPASNFVPLVSLREVTLEQLLLHTAGFTASNRFYKLVSTADELIAWYAAEGFDSIPGASYRYDDASYILLGKIVEIAAMQSFDSFCKNEIFRPLKMLDTTFNPGPELVERCAATENCDWRNGVVMGQVHDENAFAIGGVSGHAGLFSTAEDIGRFCFGLMNGSLLDLESVRQMTALGRFAPYPWQGIGWQIDPWQSKLSGFLPARSAFGHTGWTGTSIWMDMQRQNCVVLLSNTPHPYRRNMKNGSLRRPVHRAVAAALYPDSSNTHSGLDRLLREEFEPLRKKRYAVLTNHSAVDFLGRHILDVLAMAPDDCRLVRIFSPEHGLTGYAQAGEHVQSGHWKDIPVVSLYGGQNAPDFPQLADVDLLVVDLQDIGARYYTYHATMKRCLEACELHKIPVAVLDRPNPLGGGILEGPIARDTSSIVCAAGIPVRHAMTMGELAEWYKKNHFPRLKLDVIQLDGWRPELQFDALSLPWVPPSPNIPSPLAALWYVGNCLFEGVNLNEGRGTEMPFEVVGAPWLNPDIVIEAIPDALRIGARLEAIDYTPVSMPGRAVDPRYRDTPCRGIRFHLLDPVALRPFALALGVIAAIRHIHSDRFEWIGQPSFDTLLGGQETRVAIENGLDATRIVEASSAELRQFDRVRPRLYYSLTGASAL